MIASHVTPSPGKRYYFVTITQVNYLTGNLLKGQRDHLMQKMEISPAKTILTAYQAGWGKYNDIIECKVR